MKYWKAFCILSVNNVWICVSVASSSHSLSALSFFLFFLFVFDSNVPHSCTLAATRLLHRTMIWCHVTCTAVQPPQLCINTHIVYKWRCVGWISTNPDATSSLCIKTHWSKRRMARSRPLLILTRPEGWGDADGGAPPDDASSVSRVDRIT